MKNLKSFNERNSLEIDKLQLELNEFCKNSITYIVDEISDFKYRVDRMIVPNNTYIKSKYNSDDIIFDISFFRPDPNHNKFSWGEIKEEFIPIVEMLSLKYFVEDVLFFTNKDRPIKKDNPEQRSIDHILSVQDIIDDNIINGVDDIMVIKLTIKIN